MLDEFPAKVRSGWRNQADRAYGTLKDLIVEGTLAPGERLRETELAHRLDMSRTPVRESLWRLQHEGFVLTQRGERGRESTVVAPLTNKDALELFYLVGALEGVVARWVARFPNPQRNRLCDLLEEANERFRTAAGGSGSDPLEVIALDRAFHRQLLNPAVGIRLLRTYEMLKPQTVRYTLAYRTFRVESADEHEALINALRTGDADEADRAAAHNYREGAARVRSIMMVEGERPFRMS